MDNLRYHELGPISKIEVQESIKGDVQAASEALIRAALSIADRDWVESVLVDSISDKRLEVRRAAILAIGHLARIHRKITLEKVVPLLQSCSNEQSIAGAAEDALNDVMMFTGPTNRAYNV